MSRPLALTIYARFQDRKGEDWYVWKGTCMRPDIADMYAETKRLTRAELAAEVHRTDCTYWRVEADALSSGDPMSLDTQLRLTAELNTMYRFATSPEALP